MCSPVIVHVALAEEIAALAAHQLELDLRRPGCSSRRSCCARLDQVGVERAGQALSPVISISWMRFSGTGASSGFAGFLVVLPTAAATFGQHLPQQRRVGTRRDHAILRPAQLGRRDHLHGLGDLLRVLDRPDAPPDVDQTGHCSISSRLLPPRTAP